MRFEVDVEDGSVHSRLAILVLGDLTKSEWCTYAKRSFDQCLIAKFAEIEYHLDRIADRSSLVVMESKNDRC